jgi:hypothetical protein
MASPDTAKPASGLSAEPAPNVEQLGRPLNPPNTPSPDQLQAADDAGESDFAYFSARPHARHRIRSAFPGEFSRELLKPGGGRTAVVIVAIERDATGPEGGTA